MLNLFFGLFINIEAWKLQTTLLIFVYFKLKKEKFNLINDSIFGTDIEGCKSQAWIHKNIFCFLKGL